MVNVWLMLNLSLLMNCLHSVGILLINHLSCYVVMCWNEDIPFSSWSLKSVPQHLVSIYKNVRKFFSPISKTISVPEGLTLNRSVTLFITEVRAQPPVKLILHQV